MNIVIVGDGKVGNTLVGELVAEGHDVVVIDTNRRKLDDTLNDHDAIGVCGNGATYKIQQEAGVERADLLIATASSDELNILCCMVARKLGAKHTIARVRNPEYSRQLVFFKKELGLSMVVNPEQEAANEITRMLRFPAAMKVDTFAKGKVELAEIKIKEDSVLNGCALFEMFDRLRIRVLVCAVQRDEEVIIPGGNFVLRGGDIVYVTGARPALVAFAKAVGGYTDRIKNVLVVGGGKIAYYLAVRLLEGGMKVTVVERDEERCEELAQLLPKALIFHGDGTDPAILEEAGIEQANACVSLTGIDEENIMISLFAGNHAVDKIVTKVNKESFLHMLDRVGIECVVSPRKLTTDHIVRYVRAMGMAEASNSIVTLYRLVNSEVEAVEFAVTQQASYIGVPLCQLKRRQDTLIACILREGKLIFPGGQDTIEVGDSVIAVTARQSVDSLDDIFG